MTTAGSGREVAEAFQEVRRRDTGEVVGHRYRWNDGSVQILWREDCVDDVVFADLPTNHRKL